MTVEMNRALCEIFGIYFFCVWAFMVIGAFVWEKWGAKK